MTAVAVMTVLLLGSIVSAALISGAFKRESTQRSTTAEQQRDLATHNLYLAHMRQLPNDWEVGQISRFSDTLDRYLPQPGKPDLRGWEWYYFESLLHHDMMTLRGHEGAVRSVKWSPDGTTLASGGKDGTVRLWNSATGKQERKISLNGGSVSCVAWSPDGRQLAAASSDGMAHVLDASTGLQIRTISAPDSNTDLDRVAYSPDGQRLALLSCGNCIATYDAATGASQRVFGNSVVIPNDDSFLSFAWSPDGRHFAVVVDHNVKIIASDTGIPQLTMKDRMNFGFGSAWSPDGSLVAAGTSDGDISLWDAATGKRVHAIKYNASVNTVAFRPDGKLLAGGTLSERIELWSADTGNHVACLRAHLGSVTEVSWSPDGSRLASASNDGTIKIWDPLQFSDAAAIPQNEEATGLAWSPNDDRLACVRLDGVVKLMDPDTGKVLASSSGLPIDYPRLLEQHLDQPPAWSPDGRYFVSNRSDSSVVWDTSNGLREYLRIPAQVGRCAFHPDGERLAACSADRTQVQIWSLSRKAKIASFEAEVGILQNAAWNPNGDQLATAGYGVINIWNSSGQKRLMTLRGHTPNKWICVLEWSPDGKRIASAGFDSHIIVWDTETGSQLAILRGHTSHVGGVKWSRDGKRLASVSYDRTVRLWDPAGGNEILVLSADAGTPAVAWSHDGTRLVTAGSNGHCRIWDARIGYLRAKELQSTLSP